MKVVLLVVVSAVSLVAPQFVYADGYQPSHSCHKPYKPYKFTSEWELQRFKDEVDEYEQCINDFVEEQEDAVRNHKAAAQDAIEDWNRFVRLELN